MTQYRCNSCDSIFDESEAIVTAEHQGNYEAHGVKLPHYERVLACPECGDENMSQYHECVACQIEEAVTDDLCEDCFSMVEETHPGERTAAKRETQSEDFWLRTLADISRGNF